MILATKNRHKAAEIRLILAGLPLRVCSLADLGVDLPLPEEGDTYEANARAKALAVATYCRAWSLGEDSGLEVDALGGVPGVRSHRFGGPDATDRRNIELLLARLEGVPAPSRRARFRAVAVLCSPAGETWVGEGRWEGSIAAAPRGAGGFGYDPVFVPDVPPGGRTVAEMDPQTKAAFSHRALAVRALVPVIRERVAAGAQESGAAGANT